MTQVRPAAGNRSARHRDSRCDRPPAANGSCATVMVWPLAWIMVSGSVMMATWPFQKTRSPRRRPVKSAPGSIAVPIVAACMSESRSTRFPAMRIDKLDQAGAVDAEAAEAAPQIGRVDQRLGDGDIVGGDLLERQPDAWRWTASPEASNAYSVPRVSAIAVTATREPIESSPAARQLQVGAGIKECAGRRRHVRRRDRPGPSTAVGDIADIAVLLGLDPGPALGGRRR